MPAPLNNTNAEKWTEEIVNELLDSLLIYAQDCNFLGKVLCDNDISRQTWDYLQNKYEKNPVVMDKVRKVEQITETNLLNDALAGKVKETMSIFLLKCKYGYIDKQQIEVEHKGSISVNFNLQDSNQDNDTDLADPT
jgi:hypothetical protein